MQFQSLENTKRGMMCHQICLHWCLSEIHNRRQVIPELPVKIITVAVLNYVTLLPYTAFSSQFHSLVIGSWNRICAQKVPSIRVYLTSQLLLPDIYKLVVMFRP